MAEMFKDLDPDTMPRSPGLTYQDLLDQDTHEVPEVLRLQSPKDVGLNEFGAHRYTTREYHEKEVEHLWMKVWQMACREEEIPEPGDHLRYDIAGRSFVIVRQLDRSIKAYPNACLHRGRMLKEFDGHASELRCPFHGFAWELDGCLKDVPARWDFPQIKDEEFSLPEIPVATWAGFVFINPDQECEPFEPLSRNLLNSLSAGIWVRFISRRMLRASCPVTGRLLRKLSVRHTTSTVPILRSCAAWVM